MATGRKLLWGGLGAAAVFAAVGAAAGTAWIVSLPGQPRPAGAPPVPAAETAALLAGLRPRRPGVRPLVAVIGINNATEVTDYLMPYGILSRADVADVIALATEPGWMSLFPALTVAPQATTAEFDRSHPAGADYVVVPAMSRDDDPAALAWIARQAALGATVIGVCAGAKVVAAAGLLGRGRATTHWYNVGELRRKHPTVDYVADRRLVVDHGVATTTGISASMPAMLFLIEAIGGRSRAQAVADQLGVRQWDARHESSAFVFSRPFALTAIRNTLALWGRETFGIELKPGLDPVALALVADAWSRTYRSKAVTFAGEPGAVETLGGLRIGPDRVTRSFAAGPVLPSLAGRAPAEVLEATLAAIAARYGCDTARFVSMQLEYAPAEAA